jgi:hypothetical protein
LADLAAHNSIAPALTQLADWPVVSEEDEASLAFRTTASRFWLIDPLDEVLQFNTRMPLCFKRCIVLNLSFFASRGFDYLANSVINQSCTSQVKYF